MVICTVYDCFCPLGPRGLQGEKGATGPPGPKGEKGSESAKPAGVFLMYTFPLLFVCGFKMIICSQSTCTMYLPSVCLISGALSGHCE